jgi:hypothetical protein
MDNKQTLMTAGIVGVGSVALAYLGHNYLTKKEQPVTAMDKAADTVDKSSFFDFMFGDSSNNSKDVATTTVKENVKISVDGVATDPITEGEAIKETVGKAIGSFSGFFRQDNTENKTVVEDN